MNKIVLGIMGQHDRFIFRILLALACLVSTSLQAQITEIIDATGDGTGNSLQLTVALAVDSSDNVYVSGSDTNNVFRITTDGTITEIIDLTGTGGGSQLNRPAGIAVDGSGNVYVAGSFSDNVFKITPGDTITLIINPTGDGTNLFEGAFAVAVDGSGNVFAAGAKRSGPHTLDS